MVSLGSLHRLSNISRGPPPLDDILVGNVLLLPQPSTSAGGWLEGVGGYAVGTEVWIVSPSALLHLKPTLAM